ncbi:hypothetical protein Kpol_1041p39 [Vanderwaltozyma polyspora DSM 70294]|uniref:RRM domain-containing protein n=1 Tax=Vanderwaltozyma polyspora (strain ATCC 22028 / DSM 70294 / BCRC 21397 / CBS 2163 / NBRC 10782 / NRRL Y-8283 / UCD 57-17) TaxID=436907 RepID=A7TLA6_VANPO|nr:uncharacterized protein Kpol_1041p39 [Vanderwaltozyma polyspora DSM 70294]EDO16981.1 hypothetical protein Kpol_1041p39 [Vanderwaltozyma polyspora DSM 70294]
MSDPRTRRGRHLLTSEKLSSAIQVSNIPVDWTQENVTSVIAGSGPVVDITAKLDPRTGKLSAIVLDYRTSKDCKRAFELLGRIENFSCSISRIIPSNYADRKDIEKKKDIQLDRENYPWDAGLELPFEMVTEIPISRRPQAQLSTSTKNNLNANNVTIPDILSKASQHLPQLKPESLTVSDPVSFNLSKIPPLQLIEIISNLKILSNQDGNRRGQLENFLKTNLDISIAVTQALLEMGFINYNVVTQVMRKHLQTTGASNYNNNFNDFNSGMPTNGNIPMMGSTMQPMTMPSNQYIPIMQAQSQPQMSQPLPMPQQQQQQQSQQPPPPLLPPPQQQSIQQQGQQNNMAYGFPPPMPFMPPMPMVPQGQQPMMKTTPPPVSMNPMPVSSTSSSSAPAAGPPLPTPTTGGTINYAKLNTLPQEQQVMIKQVLALTPDQLQSLPEDQKSMVNNLRKEYFL